MPSSLTSIGLSNGQISMVVPHDYASISWLHRAKLQAELNKITSGWKDMNGTYSAAFVCELDEKSDGFSLACEFVGVASELLA